jgi:integrase
VYDDENVTVDEYLDAWLKGSVYGSVRRSTYDRDTNLVNNHIKPGLGGLKLKKLNSAHVQSFYHDRLNAGSAPRRSTRCTTSCAAVSHRPQSGT